MMEVEIITYTLNPELTCAALMKSTRTKETAFQLINGGEWLLHCPTDRPAELRPICQEKTSIPLHKNRIPCKYEDYCVERWLRLAKRLKHWGVFEHATFTVSIGGISRSCTHQLVRHRLASYLQQSLRHVTPNQWKVPATIDVDSLDLERFDKVTKAVDRIFSIYDELVAKGIPKEDARFILPIGTLTNISITMNAREWLHFFKLRLSKAAQWEIRTMAHEILLKLRKIAPVIFEGAGELDV